MKWRRIFGMVAVFLAKGGSPAVSERKIMAAAAGSGRSGAGRVRPGGPNSLIHGAST